MADDLNTKAAETAADETKTADARTADAAATAPDAAASELEKARKELAAARKQLDAHARAEQAKKDAQLSETEKLRKDAAEAGAKLAAAESGLKAERLSNAVEVIARDLGFLYPDDALKFLDAADVEFDEDGRPDRKSVKAALEKVLKAKPRLAEEPAPEARRRPDGSPPPRRGEPRPAPGKAELESEIEAQSARRAYAL